MVDPGHSIYHLPSHFIKAGMTVGHLSFSIIVKELIVRYYPTVIEFYSECHRSPAL